MATERQIAANRANAKKSTGPKTEAGKLASSQNATTHGLLSQIIVLKTEREPGFQELLDKLTRELEPRCALEMGYVESMAVARWRQTRLWAMQTAALDIETERQPLEAGNEPVRVALAFQSLADHSNTLTLLQRYETANERLYNRSLNMFLKVRSQLPAPIEPVSLPVGPTWTSPGPAPQPESPTNPDLPNEPNLPAKPPAPVRRIREFGRRHLSGSSLQSLETSRLRRSPEHMVIVQPRRVPR
jgi:hypothetical protein